MTTDLLDLYQRSSEWTLGKVAGSVTVHAGKSTGFTLTMGK